MLKSSFSRHCMQCKDSCQGVAEGVAKVSIPKTRLRQEEEPVPAKNSNDRKERLIHRNV
jgi:hypothetical protein